MAEVSAEAAILMLDCVKNLEYEEVVEIARQIKVYEKKGDITLVKIFDELNSTFITPFDREDIHDLANVLDDVMDYMNSCAKKIVLFHPKYLPESALALAQIVDKASDIVLQAVSGLKNIKKNAKNMSRLVNELHELENQADEIYELFLRDLFANEKDSIEVVKLKDILHELEKATDATEDVGKIIKTIIVKYA
jgi:predicted phosphate transport protein (TIGR00153 family)